MEGSHQVSDGFRLTLLEELLLSGRDDWVDASWVYGVARRTGLVDPVDLRCVSLGLILEALTNGLMLPGDIAAGDHVPWEGSVGELVIRVAEAWHEWGEEEPTPGAIVWLNLTELGESKAEVIAGRQGRG